MKSRFGRPGLLTTISKLETLAGDLSDILAGKAPPEEVLSRAPLLNRWRIGLAFSPVLVGYVVGHPNIPDGVVTTSDLWLMEEDGGWARTFSRYYRLGDFEGERDVPGTHHFFRSKVRR